jgi:hypothetical protein
VLATGLQDCNFEHIIVKWNSSSTPELHNLHILSSAGVFKYLPFSIFKLQLIICSKLQSCREEFFKDICEVVPSFINMSDFDQFKFIFSSNDLDICKMCILGVNKLYSLKNNGFNFLCHFY